MFDWENLRHFLALAHEGTLSAAARTLGVDHATVGRRVAALESNLGVRLILRMPRKVSLTAAGENVYRLALMMESSAFSIQRTARSDEAHLSGKVVISAPPILVSTLVTAASQDFLNLYPNIELSIVGDPNVISLSRREADIVIRLAKPNEPDSVPRRIGSMAFGVYASPHYEYLNAPAKWGFIGYDSDYDRFLHQQMIMTIADKRPIVFRVSDITGQLAAACARIGVALLPCFLATRSDLSRVDSDPSSFALDIWLGVHHELKDTPAIHAVVKFLSDRIRTDPALGINGEKT